MSTITLQPGDRVRLTTKALSLQHLTLDVRHHEDAAIIATLPSVIGDNVFELDRHLAGSLYWSAQELVRVKKGHSVKHTSLAMRYAGRDFIPTNFSPEQAQAIRDFEQADALNQQPCRTHTERRHRKANVLKMHAAVVSAGVGDAICAAEMARIELCRKS